MGEALCRAAIVELDLSNCGLRAPCAVSLLACAVRGSRSLRRLVLTGNAFGDAGDTPAAGGDDVPGAPAGSTAAPPEPQAAMSAALPESAEQGLASGLDRWRTRQAQQLIACSDAVCDVLAAAALPGGAAAASTSHIPVKARVEQAVRQCSELSGLITGELAALAAHVRQLECQPADGVRLLVDAICASAVTELILCDCAIGPNGARLLARAWPSRLSELDVTRNAQIGSEGFASLGASLRAVPRGELPSAGSITLDHGVDRDGLTRALRLPLWADHELVPAPEFDMTGSAGDAPGLPLLLAWLVHTRRPTPVNALRNDWAALGADVHAQLGQALRAEGGVTTLCGLGAGLECLDVPAVARDEADVALLGVEVSGGGASAVRRFACVVCEDRLRFGRCKPPHFSDEPDEPVAAAAWRDARADLAQALPAVQAACEALDTLTVDDMREWGAFRKLSPLVVATMEAVCLLKGIAPSREASRRLLGDHKLVQSLVSFDKDSVPEKTLAKLQARHSLLSASPSPVLPSFSTVSPRFWRVLMLSLNLALVAHRARAHFNTALCDPVVQTYIEMKGFNPENVNKTCSFGRVQGRLPSALCRWVRAIDAYSKVAKTVRPIMAALQPQECVRCTCGPHLLRAVAAGKGLSLRSMASLREVHLSGLALRQHGGPRAAAGAPGPLDLEALLRNVAQSRCEVLRLEQCALGDLDVPSLLTFAAESPSMRILSLLHNEFSDPDESAQVAALLTSELLLCDLERAPGRTPPYLDLQSRPALTAADGAFLRHYCLLYPTADCEDLAAGCKRALQLDGARVADCEVSLRALHWACEPATPCTVSGFEFARLYATQEASEEPSAAGTAVAAPGKKGARGARDPTPAMLSLPCLEPRTEAVTAQELRCEANGTARGTLLALLAHALPLPECTLRALSLGGTQLGAFAAEALPQLLVQCPSLTELDLSRCGLGDEAVERLGEKLSYTRLESLDLSNNNIVEARVVVLKESPLRRLVLDGNPRLSQPRESLVKRGPEAVVQFLRDKATFGVERNDMVPLFVCGLGEVGKTSLVNALSSEAEHGHGPPKPKSLSFLSRVSVFCSAHSLTPQVNPGSRYRCG